MQDFKQTAAHLRRFLVLSLMLSLFSGCAAMRDVHESKQPMMGAYASGDRELALKKSNRSGDRLMWELERGAINLDLGAPAEALKHLELAESEMGAFDSRAQINARAGFSEATALLTNPAALPYRGHRPERLMLPVYKAFAYLAMNQPESAMVEIRRMRALQQEIADDNYEDIQKERQAFIEEQRRFNDENSTGLDGQEILDAPGFQDLLKATQNQARDYGRMLNPFCVWLSALGYIYEGNLPEAMVDFRRLWEMEPRNRFVQRGYVTVAKATGEPIPETLKNVPPFDFPLQRTVFVIYANGQGPALRAERIELFLPYLGYTGLAFPKLKTYMTPFGSASIQAAGVTEKTDRLVDYDGVVAFDLSQRMPGLAFRTFLSFVTKEVLSRGLVNSMKQRNDSSQELIALIISGIFKKVFNQTDTRTWETLAKRYEVAVLPMPEDRRCVVKLSGQPDQVVTFPSQSRMGIIYIRTVDHLVLNVSGWGL